SGTCALICLLTACVKHASAGTGSLLPYTRHMRITWAAIMAAAFLGSLCHAQGASSFQPLDQWQMAVLNGDSTQLASLYSASPPAQIDTGKGNVDAATDVAFWTGLKIKSI